MKQLQIKIVLKINVLAHACLWGLRTSPALDCSGQKLGWSKLKVWGVRSRTGKCTINADAVRTEDRNFWRGAGRGQKFSVRDISRSNKPNASLLANDTTYAMTFSAHLPMNLAILGLSSAQP